MNQLKKISALEHEADAFGFSWENAMQIMAQIQSECVEVIEHLEQGKASPHAQHALLQEEIGDLLHAVFSLCVFCKLDPEETLEKTLNKFERRLNAVKSLAQAAGYTDLKGRPFDLLMDFWKQAKERVG